MELHCLPMKRENRFIWVIILWRFEGHIIIEYYSIQLITKIQKIQSTYGKTCLKWPLKRRPKFGFQDLLSLNAYQKYCRILQFF